MAAKKFFQAPAPDEECKLSRYTFLQHSSGMLEFHKREKVAKEIPFSDAQFGLFNIRFSQDGSKLIAGYGSGAIQIIDVDTGTLEQFVKLPVSVNYDPCPITSMRCIPGAGDSFFAGGFGGNIYMCRYEENAHKIFAQEKANDINCIDIDTNGNILASVGKDAAIRLYDVITGKLRFKYFKSRTEDDSSNIFHVRRIFSVRFHPKEQCIFATGGWDDRLKVWDTRVKHGCVKNIKGPHLNGDALDLKEGIIMTASWTAEEGLQIWDLGSGKLITNLVPSNRVQSVDGEFYYTCQFFKSETYHDMILTGGSGIGYVELISLNDKKLVDCYRVNKVIQTIDSNGMSKIAFGGMENVIRLVHMT